MLAENRDLPLFILGGGSNIVVSDAGFDGLVMQVCNAGIQPTASAASRSRMRAGRSPDSRQDAGVTLITVAAGEDWDRFVAYGVESDLAGVECLSGIPGLVGATPVQNVGAYGQEVAESIVSVRCFDRVEKRPVEFSNSECGFEYRKSIFNSTARDRYIVLSVTFALTKAGNPKIAYKDLRDLFPGSNSFAAGNARGRPCDPPLKIYGH